MKKLGNQLRGLAKLKKEQGANLDLSQLTEISFDTAMQLGLQENQLVIHNGSFDSFTYMFSLNKSQLAKLKRLIVLRVNEGEEDPEIAQKLKSTSVVVTVPTTYNAQLGITSGRTVDELFRKES